MYSWVIRFSNLMDHQSLTDVMRTCRTYVLRFSLFRRTIRKIFLIFCRIMKSQFRISWYLRHPLEEHMFEIRYDFCHFDKRSSCKWKIRSDPHDRSSYLLPLCVTKILFQKHIIENVSDWSWFGQKKKSIISKKYSRKLRSWTNVRSHDTSMKTIGQFPGQNILFRQK